MVFTAAIMANRIQCCVGNASGPIDVKVINDCTAPVMTDACIATPVVRNINHEAQNFAGGIFSASHDPSGNGATWSYSGAGRLQSVTVSAIEAGTPSSGNTIQVKQGASGTIVFLAKRQSQSWSVAQDNGNTNEVLTPDFNIQALGNSAFTVAWTEEI